MENSNERTGLELAGILMSRLEGSQVEDVYIDEDEDGAFLGLVFSDGEKEYHLTVDTSGIVELAEGPLEGETLDEVTSFDLEEVVQPFSDDNTEGFSAS